MTDHPGEAAIWASHHGRWSEDIAALAAAIGVAFKTLHRIRFAAPWRPLSGRAGVPVSGR